ncbi:MAG: PIN-like domain-containing protein [Sphingopyxis sp.]
MNIIPEPFDREQYDKALVEALTKTDATSVYFDTSALVWLYRVRQQARAEFVAFLDTDPLRERSHIPIWALHELNKHRKSNQVLFPLVAEYLRLTNAIKSIKHNAQLFVDDKFAGGTQWKNETAFITALESASDALMKVVKPLNQGGEVAQIDNELAPFIERHALNQKMPALAALRDEFVARCEGRFPPGFEDMSKGGKTGEATDFSGANRFGDYVFWRSIVDHAREDDAIRTVVIISHDAKRDWVHKPQKYVGYGSKPLNNDKKEDEFNCPHPMLSFEIKVEAGVERLFIVSIMRLVQAFSLQEQGAGFKELARAIQIEAGEAKASDASGAGGQDALDASEGETDAAHAAEEADVDGAKAAEAEAEVIAEAGPDAGGEPVAAEDEAVPHEVVGGDDDEGADNGPAAVVPVEVAGDLAQRLVALGGAALADGGYLGDPDANPEADQAITDLKTHNWYAQNPAVQKLDLLIADPATSDTQRFILGRNLYQSACGNAWRATQYLSELAGKAHGAQADNVAILFAGALFEAYYGPTGQLRTHLKDQMLDTLLDLADNPLFEDVRDWMAECLGGAAAHFIVYPGGARQEALFDLAFDDDGRASEIRVADTVVSEPFGNDDDDFLLQLSGNMTADRLVKILAGHFDLPVARVEIAPNFEDARNFAGLKLKPWTTNGDLTFAPP